MKLRIAHVGAGEWSRFAHGPALHRLAQQDRVSLELICDRDIERARQFRSLFGYGLASNDVHSKLDEVQPDAIVCTVQPSNTFELVQSLLPLQIPLLIEKPPGVSSFEAKSLATASIAARTFTFVAFNRRFTPSLARLKQWSAQHPIRFAHAEMLRTLRLEPDFVTATGIHALDAVRFLMGNPEFVEVRSLPHNNSAASDYSIRLTFSNSAIAEISLLLNSGLRRESYLLTSSGEAAEATLGNPYSSDFAERGDREWSQEKIVEEHSLSDDSLVDAGIIGEYEEFIRLLETGEPSTCSLADAAYSMQLAEMVQNKYSGPVPPLKES
jgi:predicted dehydrogenase